MSKGSAIVGMLIAFIGGIAIGTLVNAKRGDEIAVEATGAAAAPSQPGDPERYRIEVTRDQPAKGPEDALVTIVEFSEFECPFCKRVGPTIQQIMNEYRGKVRFVWRNNPLPFHRNAGPAAQAAMEAFDQGGAEKFWRMHDMLFENQQAIAREDLERYAGQLGLDMTQFRAALDNNEHQAKIQADQQVASTLGANGTPHFFINGRKLSGAQPFDNFKQIIDDEIRRAEALVKSGTPRNRLYAALIKNALTKAAAAPDRPQGDRPARREPDPAAVYKVPVTGDDPARGPANALVTMVMFSDFECPFCSRVEGTVTQLLTDYGNDLRVVWMNNPLPFHRNAGPAAQAAMEAFQQGGAAKFWQLHDLLFQNQRAIARENLEQYAQQVGLNMAQLRAALDNNEHQAAIDRAQTLARGLGATGTPAFFINGRNLRGAQPLEAFKRVIDEELAKARAKVAAGVPRARIYEETIKDGHTTQQFLAGAAPAAAERDGEPDPNRVYNIPVPREAPSKGGRAARVVIQQFSDFQCPFCTRVEPTVNQILQEYGDRVRVVWRNYPLPFHNDAMPAAEAAVEVFRQAGNEKFWAFHAKLFENQRALSRADLERYAQELGGIDMGQFRAALDSNRHRAAVQADMDAVTTAGARIGTPSFFINGKLLQGAQPYEQFKAAIDAALAGGGGAPGAAAAPPRRPAPAPVAH